MGKTKAAPTSDSFPELREFIKENDQRLYDFCVYMLYGGLDVDELILSIFREFGDHYRRLLSKKGAQWDPVETRLTLFRLAWQRVRETLASAKMFWALGRDTRQMKGLDEDLLRASAKAKAKEDFDEALLSRLTRIDPDFRAPLVLRDILKFDDEEVTSILGVRWGVYRHRLHRGRLEFKDSLRGRPITAEAKGITLALNPNAV